MNFNYFQTEIENMISQFPGFDVDAIKNEISNCCGNNKKIETIYNNVIAQCYGDDY
tara:strand:+ start:2883 stop:3050 length:168 start_codon:yes stop_codon:yes gene_type:complete